MLSNKEIKNNAVFIAEGVLGFEDCTKKEQLKAWQYLVNTGLAWSLQGWFGRTASALINDGMIQKKQSNNLGRV